MRYFRKGIAALVYFGLASHSLAADASICDLLLGSGTSAGALLTLTVPEPTLERVTRQMLQQQIDSMSDYQQRNFRHAIENLRIYSDSGGFFGRRLASSVFGSVGMPGLFWFPPRLSLRQIALDHPYSRIMAVHEAVHLERLVSRQFWGQSFLHYLRMSFNTRTELAEERLAHSAEYRLLREAYMEQDLPRLREQYPTAIERNMFEQLQVAGLVQDGQMVAEQIAEPILQRQPQLREAYQEGFRTALNRFFLERVNRALSSTQGDYVNHFVTTNYGSHSHLRKWLLIGGVAATTVAGALLMHYFSQ